MTRGTHYDNGTQCLQNATCGEHLSARVVENDEWDTS